MVGNQLLHTQLMLTLWSLNGSFERGLKVLLLKQYKQFNYFKLRNKQMKNTYKRTYANFTTFYYEYFEELFMAKQTSIQKGYSAFVDVLNNQQKLSDEQEFICHSKIGFDVTEEFYVEWINTYQNNLSGAETPTTQEDIVQVIPKAPHSDFLSFELDNHDEMEKIRIFAIARGNLDYLKTIALQEFDRGNGNFIPAFQIPTYPHTIKSLDEFFEKWVNEYLTDELMAVSQSGDKEMMGRPKEQLTPQRLSCLKALIPEPVIIEEMASEAPKSKLNFKVKKHGGAVFKPRED